MTFARVGSQLSSRIARQRAGFPNIVSIERQGERTNSVLMISLPRVTKMKSEK